MKKILSLFLGMALVLSACNGVTVREEEKSSDIVELHDGDTFDLMAGIIEKEINGSTVEMLAYNGSIPGPTLKIPQGATITLNLTNNIDVPTTLHSHGVRMENAFDGVPDVTQKPIERGETFSYKLKFPDAGVFWYHPHLREDWAQELGLYGNFLVTPTDASAWEPVNREVPIFVDDLLMQNGEIAAFYGEADHALMGRYGNVFLTNGETDYTLPVQKGEVVRFDFTNSANTRPFKLSIPGLKMKLMGADNGRYERETWQDAIILGPSERAMVDVLFEEPGTYNLTHSTPTEEYTLGTFTVSSQAVDISHAESFQTLHEHADVIAEMNSLRTHLEKDPDQKLRIDVKMEGMAGMHDMGGGHMMMNADMGGMMSDENSKDGIEWEDSMAGMNSMATADTVMWRLIDEVTEKENMDINWSFKKGDLAKIRIFNDPDTFHPMQHPIHFHGQRFVVLSVDGIPNENMVWKDTTLIPSGATVDILLEASNPGKWMAHCHVPEHLESGMMLNFEVL